MGELTKKAQKAMDQYEEDCKEYYRKYFEALKNNLPLPKAPQFDITIIDNTPTINKPQSIKEAFEEPPEFEALSDMFTEDNKAHEKLKEQEREVLISTTFKNINFD